VARLKGISAAARRERLLALLQHSDAEVHVAQLQSLFGVSSVTVRTDLAALAEQGLVVRTYGGATRVPERRRSELSFAAREASNIDLKQQIGLAAAELISDTSAAVLDASTTALAIARALKSRQWQALTVITNGLFTALELAGVEGVTTLLTGGIVRDTGFSLVGPVARDQLSRVNAVIGFFGGSGLTVTHGLTDVNLDEVDTKTALLETCQRVVAVVDHTKLGQVGVATFAPLARLNLIITDGQADPACLAQLRAAGAQVQVV
jgi:DeoR/GlpR family transcriptional regulator of sugar metabolism